MGFNSHTVIQDRIYGSLGYKLPGVLEAKNFQVGSNVIALTKKGEPIMTGTVSEVATDPQTDIINALMIDGKWYSDSTHTFRRL
jgi:hypothetical protein